MEPAELVWIVENGGLSVRSLGILTSDCCEGYAKVI